MNGSPLVSVILPVYNGEAFLGCALESAMLQTYKNLEIIAVDDGSTDGSLSILEEYAARDPRIRVISHPNGGVARARNRALSLARGEFVAPLDADDLWLPEKIARQVKTMLAAGEETGFVYSWWAWIGEDGTVLDRSPRWKVEGHAFEALLTVNFTGNASVPLFRRSCLEEVGGYDPSLADAKAGGCEDWQAVLLVANRYPIALVPDILLGYRRRPGSMSTACQTMWRSKEMVLAKIRGIRPDLSAAMYAGANNQFSMYLAGLAYWSGNVGEAVRWALRAGLRLPVLVAPYALRMMLFRRGRPRDPQVMAPGVSLNSFLVPEPLLPYDRIRGLGAMHDLVSAFRDAISGGFGPARVWWRLLGFGRRIWDQLRVPIWFFLRGKLRLEAALHGGKRGRRQPRILSTACWHFPIYSQTFVYRELLGMMKAGFAVRFAYSALKPKRELPDDLMEVWRIKRWVPFSDSIARRDLRHFNRIVPGRVKDVVRRLSEASGLSESEILSHPHVRYAFSFARMAEAWKADYIHTYFFYEQALYGMVASCLLDIPRGVSCYADHMLDDYELKLVGMHLRDCDVIVATSGRIRSELEAIAGVPLPASFVKPNGIDSTRFSPEPNRSRESGQANERVWKIVAVNRIHPKKGMTYLAEAALMLRDRGVRFAIDLLGEYDEHDPGSMAYFEQLKEFIAAHGLESLVQFRGRQDAVSVRRYLAAGDIFLAPFVELANGDKDGIPTALLEGMAAGCAVVSTDSGSMLEVVRDGVEALVVPQCDSVALADAIERLVRDEELRQRLVVNAIERVRLQFDVSVCEAILHARIREALGKRDPFRYPSAPGSDEDALTILLLSFEYPPETGYGGIGTYTWYQARALAKLGHRVHVLAGSRECTPLRTELRDGVLVHRYRARGLWMNVAALFGTFHYWWTRQRLENAWCMFWGLRKLLKHYRFDVLEMPECGAEGVLLNWLTDVPTVVRFHGPSELIMPFYDVPAGDIACCSFLERIGIETATCLTSCSAFLARDVRECLGVRRHIPVIANGIDLALFDNEPAADIERLYDLPPGKVTILFAGRMEPRKGIHLCGAICEAILREHDVTFLFAGDDLFDYLSKILLPSLSEKGLRGSVRYLGKLRLQELRACARAVDIYLLPSLWENMPYACLEAMAAGRAVVTSCQGGMPELIVDEENGLLAELGSSESFSRQLHRLIEDPDLRSRLGTAARRTIERGFADRHIAELSVEVYKRCIDGT